LERVPEVNASVVFGNAFINFVALEAVVREIADLGDYKKWALECSKFSFRHRFLSQTSGKDKPFDRS
jgi:hypothetical protein